MKRALAVVSLLLTAACGGSNPSGPNPVPSPSPTPQAARAVIVLGHRNNVFTVSSRTQIGQLTLVCGTAHVEYVFGEQAGLGATLVQADVYLIAANGDISGRRVSPGNNEQIEAHGSFESFSDRIECGYIGRDYPFRYHSIWDWRDDRGNAIQVVGEVGLIEQ